MYKILVITLLCSMISYGVRGPKKHLKQLASPRHWMLDKMSGIFARNSYVIENIKDEGNTYSILVYDKPFEIKLIERIDLAHLEIDDTMTKEEEQT